MKLNYKQIIKSNFCSTIGLTTWTKRVIIVSERGHIIYDRYISKKTRTKKDTVWEYRFEIASISGKRQWISKSGFRTKTEAREAGKEAKKKYEQVGVSLLPTDMSYSDFLDYWIEKRCKLVCKEVTVEGYEKKIRLYIKPALGGYKLTSIRKDNVQQLITDMYHKGFSRNTLSAIKGIITKSFDFAMEDEHRYITHNPASTVIIPKPTTVPKKKTRSHPHVYIPAEQMEKYSIVFQKDNLHIYHSFLDIVVDFV